MPDLCTYVTERASEGPCEYVILEDGDDSMLCEGVHYGIPAGVNYHAYLGPVLARCGHEEREHIPEPTVGAHCASCHDSNADEHCKHAFTNGD